MKRLAAVTVLASIAASAAHAAAPSATSDLRPGMTKHQVIALMGTPDSGVAYAEKECSYYNLYRNRWSGPAGGSPDRYTVCFQNDAVTSFGLEQGPQPVGYPPFPELPR
jgi:outer membrane protein assembly factor BamE (lipoprotein component of BamABCDE complex)